MLRNGKRKLNKKVINNETNPLKLGLVICILPSIVCNITANGGGENVINNVIHFRGSVVKKRIRQEIAFMAAP
jgi:hypothetical protein